MMLFLLIFGILATLGFIAGLIADDMVYRDSDSRIVVALLAAYDKHREYRRRNIRRRHSRIMVFLLGLSMLTSVI
jgi:hypothetical protein